MNIPPALAERSEAEAVYDFVAGAPASVRAALGIDALRIGGGVALSMRDDPTEFWSKALGFGIDEPVTADLMDEVCAFYRFHRTPIATFQLAPSVLPEDWADICARLNLRAGSPWVKLVCDAQAPAPTTGWQETLRVRRVEPEQAAAWASVVLRVFGMPEEHLSEMVASSVGRSGWHSYGAWEGDDLVAAGTVYVRQDTAQMFAGSTLPHARRRGAQSALLAARAAAAGAAGCRWLVAETGAEAPGEHNSSLHNMLRAGFEVLYERQNWVWRP
ncbi:hypothetical protein [Microbispora sp. NPDC049125]|uniref:hypothetical protein n=1 Tax=Microbispora sp. NPDC049125 TaxID=3154929 RepID=UPI0034672B7F